MTLSAIVLNVPFVPTVPAVPAVRIPTDPTDPTVAPVPSPQSPDELRQIFHKEGLTDPYGTATQEAAKIKFPPVPLDLVASNLQYEFEIAHQDYSFGRLISGKEFINTLIERCTQEGIRFEPLYTTGSIAKKAFDPAYITSCMPSFIDTPAIQAWLHYLHALPTPDVDTFLSLKLEENEDPTPKLNRIRDLMIKILEEKLPPLTPDVTQKAVQFLQRKYPDKPQLWRNPEAEGFRKIIAEYLLFAKLSPKEEKILIAALANVRGWRFEITFGKKGCNEIFAAIALNSQEILTSSGPYAPVIPEGPNRVQCLLNHLLGCELPGPHAKNENFLKALLVHMTKGISYCPRKSIEKSLVQQAKAAADPKHRVAKKLLERGIPLKNIFPYFMAEIMRHSIQNHLFGDPLAAIACTFNALCAMESVATALELEIFALEMQRLWLRSGRYPQDHPLIIIGAFLAYSQGTIEQRLAFIKLCLFIATSQNSIVQRNQEGAHLVEANFSYSLMADVQAVSTNLWHAQQYFQLDLDPQSLSLVDAVITLLWPTSVIMHTQDALETLPQSLSSQVPQEFLLAFLLSVRTLNTGADPIIYLPKLISCYPQLARSILLHYSSINKSEYDLRPIVEILERNLSPEQLEAALLDAVFQILLQKSDSIALLGTMWTKEILPNPNLYRSVKQVYASRIIQQKLSPSVALRCLVTALKEQLFTMQEEIELLPGLLSSWMQLSPAQRAMELPSLETVCEQLQVIDALGVKPDLAKLFHQALQIIPVNMRSDRLHDMHRRLELATKPRARIQATVAPAPSVPATKGRKITLNGTSPPPPTPPAPAVVEKGVREKYEHLLNRKDLGTAGKELIDLIIADRTLPLYEIAKQFIANCTKHKQIGACLNFLNNPSIYGRLKNSPRAYLDLVISYLNSVQNEPRVASTVLILFNGFDENTAYDLSPDTLRELIQLLQHMQIPSSLHDPLLSKAKYLIPCLQQKDLLPLNLQFYAIVTALGMNSEARQAYSRSLVHQLIDHEFTHEFLTAHKNVLTQIIDDTLHHANSPAARLLRKIADTTRNLHHAEECVIQIKRHCILNTIDDFKWIIHIVFRFQEQLTPQGIARFFHYFTGQVARPTKKWENLYATTLEACQTQGLWLLGIDFIRLSPFASLREHWSPYARTFIDRALRTSTISKEDLAAVTTVVEGYCPNDREVWEQISVHLQNRECPQLQDKVWEFLNRYADSTQVASLWYDAVIHVRRHSPTKVEEMLRNRECILAVAQQFTPQQLQEAFKSLWNCWSTQVIKQQSTELARFTLEWSRLGVSALPSDQLFDLYLYLFQNLLLLDGELLVPFADTFQCMVQELPGIQGASVKSAQVAVTALQRRQKKQQSVESLTRSLGVLFSKAQIPIEVRMPIFAIYAFFGASSFLVEGLHLADLIATELKKRPREILPVLLQHPVGDFFTQAAESETTLPEHMLSITQLLHFQSALFQPSALQRLVPIVLEKMLGIAPEALHLFLKDHRYLTTIDKDRYQKLMDAFIQHLFALPSHMNFIRSHTSELFTANTKEQKVSPFFLILAKLVSSDKNSEKIIVLLNLALEMAKKDHVLREEDRSFFCCVLIELIYHSDHVEYLMEFSHQIKSHWRRLSLVCHIVTVLRFNMLPKPFNPKDVQDVVLLVNTFVDISASCDIKILPTEVRTDVFTSFLPILTKLDISQAIQLVSAYLAEFKIHEREILDCKLKSCVNLILSLPQVPPVNIAEVLEMFYEPEMIAPLNMTMRQKIEFCEWVHRKMIALDKSRWIAFINKMTLLAHELGIKIKSADELKELYLSFSQYAKNLESYTPDKLTLHSRSFMIVGCFAQLRDYFENRNKIPTTENLRKEDDAMALRACELWKQYRLDEMYLEKQENLMDLVTQGFHNTYAMLTGKGPYYSRLAKMMYPSDSLFSRRK